MGQRPRARAKEASGSLGRRPHGTQNQSQAGSIGHALFWGVLGGLMGVAQEWEVRHSLLCALGQVTSTPTGLGFFPSVK